MLQAKTYLFCAIRPECTYLKYTFATLGFAKNASVVQLSPKKATTAKSPAERKLMLELEKYKQMVEQMKGAGGGGGGDSEEVARLQAMLAEQQAALQKAVNEDGDDGGAAAALAAEQEKKVSQYAKRGIVLFETVDIESYMDPYLLNLDEDEFRSRRFLYALKEGETTFGSDGDVRPPSFSVKKGHCKVVREGASCKLAGGKGETFVMGKRVGEGEEVALNCGDWVLMGDEPSVATFAASLRGARSGRGPDARLYR